jgi:O-antigen ligase
MMLGALAYFVLLCLSLLWLHLPPEIVLGLTLGGLGLIVLMLNPLIGVHAFLMLSYFEYAIPEKEGLSGMKLIGAFIISGWLIAVIIRRRLNLKMNGLLVASVLFVAWCGISTVYAISTDAAFGRMFTFAQLLAAMAMFYSVVDSVKKLRGIFWAILVWTTLSTVIALIMYNLGTTEVAIGFVGNRNLLATYIIIAIVCAYLLHQVTESRVGTVTIMCSLPVLFLGLALTLSRTGLIVLGMGLVVVWYRVLREQGFLLLAGSVVILCIIMLMLPDAFWHRAGTIVPSVERQEGTFGTRVQLWRIGLRMIEDRPLTGVGPGNFMPAFDRYARGPLLRKPLVAHNSYVSVAAEDGIPALVLFVLMNLTALSYARRTIKSATRAGWKELRILAVTVEVIMLVIMGVALSGSSEHMKYQWMVLGIAMSMKRMADDLPGEPGTVAIPEGAVQLSRSA